jgi:peptidoglycan-N-acetylglucosamine deacetylase
MSDHAALTFDDGPDPVWTPKILKTLEDHSAAATFFVMVDRAASHPEILDAILTAGHAVEYHCAQHLRHTETPREVVATETERGLATLRGLGAEPRYWRPPWGLVADWTQDLADDFDLTLAGWTVDTHDWRGDGAARMLGAVGPLLAPQAVVLMHDGLGPGALRRGCEETVALVGPLVSRLRLLGCEPLTLDALERTPPPRRTTLPEVPA